MQGIFAIKSVKQTQISVSLLYSYVTPDRLTTDSETISEPAWLIKLNLAIPTFELSVST
jgi:hypothetical protein